MFDLKAATILLTIHGSHSYGMASQDSDLDIDGVCIPPSNVRNSFCKQFEQQRFSSLPFSLDSAEYRQDAEGTIYEIRKFFRLAADCNPNIIEILFTEESDVLLCTAAGCELRNHATSFLSQKAKHTFSGYAHSQLKRVKTHRRWLLDPPSHKPSREEYGLDPNSAPMSSDEYGAFQALGDEELKRSINESVWHVFEAERRYRSALNHWGQYQNWLSSRNPRRAELEARFGYDTKHAAHLVRLMRMCREILVEGVVRVKRPDAQELLAIRRGEWSYDALVEWAEREDAELETIYREGTSPLPKSPDRKRLDELCIHLIETGF